MSSLDSPCQQQHAHVWLLQRTPNGCQESSDVAESRKPHHNTTYGGALGSMM
jgi:hypothetical protein